MDQGLEEFGRVDENPADDGDPCAMGAKNGLIGDCLHFFVDGRLGDRLIDILWGNDVLARAHVVDDKQKARA